MVIILEFYKMLIFSRNMQNIYMERKLFNLTNLYSYHRDKYNNL